MNRNHHIITAVVIGMQFFCSLTIASAQKARLSESPWICSDLIHRIESIFLKICVNETSAKNLKVGSSLKPLVILKAVNNWETNASGNLRLADNPGVNETGWDLKQPELFWVRNIGSTYSRSTVNSLRKLEKDWKKIYVAVFETLKSLKLQNKLHNVVIGLKRKGKYLDLVLNRIGKASGKAPSEVKQREGLAEVMQYFKPKRR